MGPRGENIELATPAYRSAATTHNPKKEDNAAEIED